MMIKLGLTSLLSLSLSLAACDSAERIYDCASICNSYKECVDEDYDVTTCTSRCEDEASDSEAYEDKADKCQSCVNDRSCTSAVFNCTDDCIGIVP